MYVKTSINMSYTLNSNELKHFRTELNTICLLINKIIAYYQEKQH